MQQEKDILVLINQLIKNELTAINQYFMHAKILKHMGFQTLAKKAYEESIDEMNHADKLADRILYLGGLPNFQDLGKLMIGQKPIEMLECDFALEKKNIPDLQTTIAVAEDQNDYGTVELLSEILVSEEEHYLWLEQQLNIVKNIGEQNYLQSQV